MDMPPDLEAKLRKVEELEIQRRQDPRAFIPLIEIYKQIIEQVQPDEKPLFYAAVQYALGNVYSKLQIGDLAANLMQAIACHQEALRFFTLKATPLEYAATQNNLGTVYLHLPTGDPTANLNRAITHFKETLRVWIPETLPFDYARARANLGMAYSSLPKGDRSANLKQAIECYQEALRFWTAEAAPREYASVHNGLGNAYSQLPTGDRSTNLVQAISCYQEALRFWTAEAAPWEYSGTQNNLGNVYCLLPTGDQTANLIRAIACYQEALRFRTAETVPLEYARTQNNLGSAYLMLPTGDRATDLVQAIVCFKEALRFWTAETVPLEYARVQINLGNAYYELSTGDRATNLAQAIACFKEALRFWTVETAPFNYSMVQNSLGNAYYELSTGDRATNLAQAIACFKEALRFWTVETAPNECRMTSRNLAHLYFEQGKWQAALEIYMAAINAGEQLYRAGLSAASKATEMTQNAKLYRRAAIAAVRCGKKTQALLILDQGKTRLLAEALRLRVPRPTNVPDEVWTAFEDAGKSVRAVQAWESTMYDVERDLVGGYNDRLQAVRNANTAMEAAIERVRGSAPHFLRQIGLSTILAQLPDEHTVLVIFCIVEKESIAFIVGRDNLNIDIKVVEVHAFGQIDLIRLLVSEDEDSHIRCWLADYHRYLIEHTLSSFHMWQETIASTLDVLGQQLLTPILSTLPNNVNRLILIPSNMLSLFPLHAAPLSRNGSELVCERYQVSYAPSIEVLADARSKVRHGAMPELYAVINPEGDPNLVFTSVEGMAIAQFFGQSEVDEGRVGTKQHMLAGVQGRSYVHFSCHGSYNWFDPPASGLAFADEHLTLADLQQGKVDLSAAQLVTLSACETGITDILKGSAEEFLGLPAGLLLSGVPCVVSSLWAVEDFSTSLLMEEFYRRHLIQGQGIDQALQEAQRWLRRLTRNEVMAYMRGSYEMVKSKFQYREQLSPAAQALVVRLQALEQVFLEDYGPEECPFAHPYHWAAFLASGAV